MKIMSKIKDKSIEEKFAKFITYFKANIKGRKTIHFNKVNLNLNADYL